MHARAHTHTHARARVHAHTHSLSLALSLSLSLSLSLALSLSFSLSLSSLSLSLSLFLFLAHSLSRLLCEHLATRKTVLFVCENVYFFLLLFLLFFFKLLFLCTMLVSCLPVILQSLNNNICLVRRILVWPVWSNERWLKLEGGAWRERERERERERRERERERERNREILFIVFLSACLFFKSVCWSVSPIFFVHERIMWFGYPRSISIFMHWLDRLKKKEEGYFCIFLLLFYAFFLFIFSCNKR